MEQPAIVGIGEIPYPTQYMPLLTQVGELGYTYEVERLSTFKQDPFTGYAIHLYPPFLSPFHFGIYYEEQLNKEELILLPNTQLNGDFSIWFYTEMENYPGGIKNLMLEIIENPELHKLFYQYAFGLFFDQETEEQSNE